MISKPSTRTPAHAFPCAAFFACVFALVIAASGLVAQVPPDDASQLYGTWVSDAEETALLGEIGTAEEIRHELGEVTFTFNPDGTGVMEGRRQGETLRIPYNFEATRRDETIVFVQFEMFHDAFDHAELTIQLGATDDIATFRPEGDYAIVMIRQSNGPDVELAQEARARAHSTAIAPDTQPGGPVDVATVEHLFGVWRLDVNSALEILSPEDRELVGEFLHALEMVLTFDQDGVLTSEMSAFGESEVERTTYTIRAARGATLVLQMGADEDSLEDLTIEFLGEDLITMQEGTDSEVLRFYRVP